MFSIDGFHLFLLLCRLNIFTFALKMMFETSERLTTLILNKVCLIIVN